MCKLCVCVLKNHGVGVLLGKRRVLEKMFRPLPLPKVARERERERGEKRAVAIILTACFRSRVGRCDAGRAEAAEVVAALCLALLRDTDRRRARVEGFFFFFFGGGVFSFFALPRPAISYAARRDEEG